MAVLASELLRDPNAECPYRGGYAAPNAAAFLARLAATNGTVRHLIGCVPAPSR